MISEVRLSERRKEKRDGFEGCGSGIVEGGFERSVSPATWERRIRDVGGEMGFAGMKKSFALVDRVHTELKVGGGEVEWIGYGGTACRSVGDLGPTSVCWVELRLSLIGAWGGAEGRWVSDPCALSLSLSVFVSPGNHLKVK